MGTTQCKPPRDMQPNMGYKSAVKLKITESISNPSLLTISENNDIFTTVSETFGLDNWDKIYNEYVAHAKQNSIDITQDAMFHIVNALDAIASDEHLLFVASKFEKLISQSNDTQLAKFTEHADKNITRINELFQFDMENRQLIHVMYYLKVQRILLNGFEDKKGERGMELINLIALSHLIMMIEPEQFKLFSINIIKSMLHFDLISEENLPQIVYYHETINSRISEAMEKYRNNHFKKYANHSDFEKPCRENFRELKKWKLFVINTGKTLIKPMTELQQQISLGKRIVICQDTQQQQDSETWKIIRQLKKGYKYKKATTAKVF